MEVRVVSWNVFHGRDRAPDGSLHTWRSRLLKITERGPTHAQVNCDLFEQFCTLLAAADWDVALLQECPPRWAEGLATACGAEPHLVLTARNLPPGLSRLQALAGRLNPDLTGSWEGGCNLTLVRTADPRRGAIAERRELTLTRSPETRRMAFTRLLPGLCVANLHASEPRRGAEEDVEMAARVAVSWAGDLPVIFGGDLNLRPASSPALFEDLDGRFLLQGPTGKEAIDHILSRGLDRLEPTRPWEPERREVPDPTTRDDSAPLPIRLSDHAPVEAVFAFGGAGS